MSQEPWKDEQLKTQLHTEMQETIFSEEMKNATIRRVQATKRSSSIWKRELTIPVPVIALTMAILIIIPVFGWMQANSLENDQAKETVRVETKERLIVSGAGVFYESQLTNKEEEGD